MTSIYMSCHIHLHLLLSGYAQIVIHVSKFFSVQVLLSHSWPNRLWSICREHLMRVFNFGLKLRKTNCFFYFCMGMEETNFVYIVHVLYYPWSRCFSAKAWSCWSLGKNGHIGHSGKIPLFLSKIVIDTSGYIVYNLIYRYDKQESLY